MSAVTLAKPDVAPAPLLDVPQLDDALDVSIDSVIAQAARSTRVRKVKGSSNAFLQSASSRAWTRGGSVD